MKSPIYTKNVPPPGIGSTVVPIDLVRRNIVNMFIDNHIKCHNVLFKQTSTQIFVYHKNNNKSFDMITLNK